MRPDDLLDVIGKVDDELLERSEKAAYKKKTVWKRWIPLAACVCLIFAAGANWLSNWGFVSKDLAMESINDIERPEIMGGTAAEQDVEAAPEEQYGFEEPKADNDCVDLNPLKKEEVASNTFVIYKYDGETISCAELYDNAKRSEFLDAIAELDFALVEGWMAKELTYPIYGIKIEKENGTELNMAWSNNCWINENETVVWADYDLSGWEAIFEWNNEAMEEGFTIRDFPCAEYLFASEEDGFTE